MTRAFFARPVVRNVICSVALIVVMWLLSKGVWGLGDALQRQFGEVAGAVVFMMQGAKSSGVPDRPA